MITLPHPAPAGKHDAYPHPAIMPTHILSTHTSTGGSAQRKYTNPQSYLLIVSPPPVLLQMAQPIEYLKRPQGLGLGAAPPPPQQEDRKKVVKMGGCLPVPTCHLL